MTSCMPPDRELVIIMAVASLCVSSTMCLRQRAPVKLPAHGPIIARVMAGNSGRRSNRTNRSQSSLCSVPLDQGPDRQEYSALHCQDPSQGDEMEVLAHGRPREIKLPCHVCQPVAALRKYSPSAINFTLISYCRDMHGFFVHSFHCLKPRTI
ncbi:hypothetical protein RRG08_001092 [Elysia crispata]|uniref:Uncharacterized protein n=1 Tax=Elysia crispata TaxID=231223 RepID=A0AAE1AX47_9GAST|nr:hypothetical protein RRG08_001092 [Elysia crispata]